MFFANSQQLFYTYVNQINQYQCKKNLVQQISNRLSISWLWFVYLLLSLTYQDAHSIPVTKSYFLTLWPKQPGYLFNFLPFCLFVCLLRQSHISRIVSQWLILAYAVGLFSQHLTLSDNYQCLPIMQSQPVWTRAFTVVLQRHSYMIGVKHPAMPFSTRTTFSVWAHYKHIWTIAWQLCIKSHQHLRCRSQERSFHEHFSHHSTLSVGFCISI